MSAWIVARAHIDALVLAGVQWGLVTHPDPEQLAELGRLLWAENLASVAYRYPDDGDGERPGRVGFRDADTTTYTAPAAEVLLSTAGVVKAITCYDYQTCQHPAWGDPGNPARAYTQALQAAVIATATATAPDVSGGRPYLVGYDQAPWGVDDLAEIAAQPSAESR